MKTAHLSMLSIAIGLVVGSIVTTTSVLQGRHAIERTRSIAEQRCSAHCAIVKKEVSFDAIEFDSPEFRDATMDRFATSLPFHSLREIEMCSEHPPNSQEHLDCLNAHDYACLARLAQTAADAIPP